jgi:hypothetical protein
MTIRMPARLTNLVEMEKNVVKKTTLNKNNRNVI